MLTDNSIFGLTKRKHRVVVGKHKKIECELSKRKFQIRRN
jgi:hypothetical protein